MSLLSLWKHPPLFFSFFFFCLLDDILVQLHSAYFCSAKMSAKSTLIGLQLSFIEAFVFWSVVIIDLDLENDMIVGLFITFQH